MRKFQLRVGRFQLCSLVFAAFVPGSSEASTRAISVDDVLAIERLDQVSVSPDRKLLAAVVLRGALRGETFGRAAYEVDPSRGDIWILDRASGAPRNLTRGKASASGAWCTAWSPDGQHLAFLSTRSEGAEPRGGDNVRLYVWDRKTDRFARMGEMAVLTQTRYGGGINRLDIAGPNERVAGTCTAGDENAPFVWLDESHLLVVALPPGRVSGLLDQSEKVYRHTAATREALRTGTQPMVSASGSGAELTVAGSDQTALLSVVDVTNNARTDIASVPAYPFNGSLSIRVSPDGGRAAVLATTGAIAPRAGVAWVRNDPEWVVEKRLGFVDLARGRPVNWLVLPDQARLPVALESWSADGRSITLSARSNPQDRAAIRQSIQAETGKISELAPPPASSSARPPAKAEIPAGAMLLTRDDDGLVWSESTAAGTFVRARAVSGGAVRNLLSLNTHFADIDLGRTVPFDYVAADGRPLKAAVLLPPKYRPGTRLPMITWVYGGAKLPGWAEYSLDPFMPGIYNLRLYAARGYGVLLPSIPLKRDGTEDHLTALGPAVLPAVDKLIELGFADPARIGVMGQSYGGYTTMGLVTQTSRFKAAVSIAGISDLIAYHGSFDPTARGYAGIEHEKSANMLIAELTAPGLQMAPYDDPDRYLRNSPLTYAKQVTTPLLLIHGELDIRGSSYQSEAMFSALWRQGKTARILRYWGEDHALAASPATVRSVVDEITRWFDKYLPPTTSVRSQ